MDPTINKITKSSLRRSSITSIPTSFATVSLGASSDPLNLKLSAISSAGFKAIELGFPDLVSFASAHQKKEVKEDGYESLCRAGEEVQKLCRKHKLQILMLQSLSHFEGWKKGSKEREDAFQRARGWIRIMQSLGTDMLQVGSSDATGISTTPEDIIHDIQELADMLAEHNFRLAYENLSWSTHAPTWATTWAIINATNRPNIGLCLDTFQIAGGEYADPSTPHGLISTQGIQPKLEMNFKATLVALAREVPADRIYVLQVSDARRPPEPLADEGLPPRARWSQAYRTYPFNGGYLPVVQVVKAVLATGFRGWFSTEVFDGGVTGVDFVKPEGFEAFAKGAMESHGRLLDECANT